MNRVLIALPLAALEDFFAGSWRPRSPILGVGIKWPADARIVGVRYECGNDYCYLVAESASFRRLAPGEELYVMDLNDAMDQPWYLDEGVEIEG